MARVLVPALNKVVGRIGAALTYAGRQTDVPSRGPHAAAPTPGPGGEGASQHMSL